MANYRRGSYDFVVDSSFTPFSMQELLTPFLSYKENFEKTEAVLDELNKNTDTFKYLEQVAKDNPESEAAQIYNTYASDLKRYRDDFSANGLSMANKRGLLNMKRRYQGEIGLLDAASKAMEEVKKSRRENKDPSMLYNEDNLNIDQFLYGKNPNLYGISGNYLYTKGAALGKAISSRMYKAGDEGSVLGGYYRNWKETRGVSQESIADFVNSDAVQREVDNLLMAEGVKDNLTGANYEKARQQALNGLYTSIVYEESNKPVEDNSKISAAQQAQLADNRDARALSALQSGYVKKNGKWTFDTEAYEEHLNAISNLGGYNPDEWVYGPDGKWHRKPKSPAPKQPNITLRENTYYDEKGNTGPVKELGNAGYGKEITYEVALSKYPNQVINHHPGYGRYYRYYEGFLKGGTKVLNIIQDPSKLNTGEVPASIKDEGDDDA